MKKKVVRVIAAVLSVLLVCSLAYGAASIQPARAVTQAEIDTLKSQAADLADKQKDVQSQINSLQYQQSDALAKKTTLDKQIDITEEQIDNINRQISTYDQMITDKQAEVQQAQASEDAQLLLYKRCVRDMEENGPISYLAVIFDANSFADLLARVDTVSDIMSYDDNVYQNLGAAKQATIAAEQSLKDARAAQEQQKADLQTTQEQLNGQLTQATGVISQLESSIDSYEALLQQEQDAADQIQQDINAKVAQLQAQQQAEAAAAAAAAARGSTSTGRSGSSGGGTVVGIGNLLWPSGTCRIVTCPYGQRISPITGKSEFHKGVDIGAKYGTDILAADSGTVILSAYQASYGNYIVISHGNGMTTLYAHMGKRLVSVGDEVTRGETIGLVGATGDATGPHIHFEVSVNGARQNPLNYFSGYSVQ